MLQGLDEGKCSYQGRSWNRFGFYVPRSQRSTELTPKSEVIVVISNEPMNESEDSQNDEGLNVFLVFNLEWNQLTDSHPKRKQVNESVT